MTRRPPPAVREPVARAAACLAVLALLLRILLPALHDHHGHRHLAGPAADHDGAVAAVCCCGHVHTPAPTTAPGDGQIDAAEVGHGHFCVACEVELGTPGACAALPPALPSAAPTATLAQPRTARLPAPVAARWPPDTAPPSRSC
ncbi:MAG: hypothetical protein H6835_18040 [Planctomycetes bacterium]|nr:hypothetical protein [Planctomycetota bacterium]